MKLKLKKDKLLGQKKLYVALLCLLVFGALLGILFPLFLSVDDKELLQTSISTFFNNLMNHQLDYATGLQNSLIANFSFLIGVWLFGISIIGVPVVLFLLFYKGFIFGFSFSSIIKVYGVKGILSAVSYVFPGMFLSLIATVLLSFYSISFSIKLFRYLFLKENFNFKFIMNKYLKILGICAGVFLIVSILDVYLAPIVMNLFTFLLK